MAYQKTNWKDHISETPNKYRETANADGTVTLTKVEGNIVQEGTPISASNLNKQENGIFEGVEGVALIVQELVQAKREIEDNKAEIGTVSLTNTSAYPFNNSKKTVAIVEKRNTIRDYEVSTTVLSADGPVGDIKVSDKQVNGFKIEYTGSAKNVMLKYYLRGGIR